MIGSLSDPYFVIRGPLRWTADELFSLICDMFPKQMGSMKTVFSLVLSRNVLLVSGLKFN